MNQKQILSVRNGRTEPIVLRVEPWADELLMQPGEVVRLEFQGPSGAMIEMEAEPSAIVVYGWVGAKVDIHRQNSG